jgi:EAL domain-containing protein (putative c-di-GMP-specific phosphodiesterase class I)/ActR/RegA family two-component response regulator
MISLVAMGEREDESAILLVDDDEQVRAVLQRALESVPMKVSVASDGASALALLAEQQFDAVVSDIVMPGMNGIKLLHAVREHDLDLPVVLVTGNPDLKTATLAVEYGAFQYLIKPVAIERLRVVVARAVDVGRLARLKRQCAQEFGSGSFYIGDRAGVDAKLDRALRSLWMAYQPVVSAVDGSVYGYEALLRSEEPQLLLPKALFKAAEKVRRIHEVGRAVRDAVASDIEFMPHPSAFAFLNIHPEDLLDPALYLPSAPLTRIAARVVLELTDRASLDSVNDVRERIGRLRALGFRIAIDDVGAAQGDASTFGQLEPEFVKIDLPIIRGVEKDPAKTKMVQALVRLCHNMGKAVIAEGVENEGERDALVDAGCDYLQGFFLGIPTALRGRKGGPPG